MPHNWPNLQSSRKYLSSNLIDVFCRSDTDTLRHTSVESFHVPEEKLCTCTCCHGKQHTQYTIIIIIVIHPYCKAKSYELSSYFPWQHNSWYYLFMFEFKFLNFVQAV